MFIMLDLKKSQYKANKVKVEAVIYGQCSETFGHNFFGGNFTERVPLLQ